jgi:hypothetical protein|tara:strand:+ start:3351 stop:3977 length:627 start_codon:yes stop_codon:yes gene_type:complete
MSQYEQLKLEAEKPVTQRKVIIDSQGNEKKIRKYHKTSDKLLDYWTKRKVLGAFLNPFERDGPYKAQIGVLMLLGIDRWHSFANIKAKLPEIMKGMKSSKWDNQWAKFSQLPDNENGKDIDGRIMLNFEVMQRLSGNHPYGYKLQEAQACVDIQFVPQGEIPGDYNGPVKDCKGTYYYRLNTQFLKPEEVQPSNNYKGKRRGRPKKKK